MPNVFVTTIRWQGHDSKDLLFLSNVHGNQNLGSTK
jgi:hypothetical protein